MRNCWICGNVADSEEHKFKASDIKKFLGKKIEAYYISKDAIELNSYKDKLLKFPKVICTICNTTLTRPHDDAYDKFIDYCLKNNCEILEFPIINFEAIYGYNWVNEKANLYRYYAKHAGCKIVTSNVKADVSNLAEFIKGNLEVEDFIVRFEMKAGVKAIMNVFNSNNRYHHLYNSETFSWNNSNSPKFGGWLTNNYITVNWVFGKKINTNSKKVLTNSYDFVMLTDGDFFELDDEKQNVEEFCTLNFVDQFIVGFENGYKKTKQDKIEFYEYLIDFNNSL